MIELSRTLSALMQMLAFSGPLRTPVLGPSVRIQAQPPCGLESTAKHVLARFSQHDVRHPHSTPPARDRHEDLRQFPYKSLLFLRRENQVSIAVGLRRECREYPTTDAEVNSAHV